MSLNAKRLKWIRKSLRGLDGRPVDRQALSACLGWPENRWKNLEGALPWGDGSREWVREGLLALVARTTLPEGAGPKAVRYVMGESAAKPWSSPPAWLEGQCPVNKKVGRPPRVLARPEPAGAGESRVARPVFPSAVRSSQTEAILRALAGGTVDVETALGAITDIFEPLVYYYNKHDRTEPFTA